MTLLSASDEKQIKETEFVRFIEKSIVLASDVSDSVLEAHEDAAIVGVFDNEDIACKMIQDPEFTSTFCNRVIKTADFEHLR